MKRSILAVAITALASMQLNASDNTIIGAATDIVLSVEAGNIEAVAVDKLASATLGLANSGLDKIEDEVLSTSNFTHFDLTLGSDALGLAGSGTKAEVTAVYRLIETDNWFMFNQMSAVNYNSRTTLNTGFGARHINDAETVITGINAFYDYELQSKHKRNGVGVELLSSIFELRANHYNAVSGTLVYNGVDETALGGNDVKFTANLPYLYSSNVYSKVSNWKDGAGYKTKYYETGLSAEFIPNLIFSVAAQRKNSGNTKYVGSVTYSAPLGSANKKTKVRRQGGWSTALQPVRDKLYAPVQRENRIMKSVVGAVTVKGY
jgi:predicted small secreted protein